MSAVIPIVRADTKDETSANNKCSRCRGSTCCTYVTQHIDTPRSIEDFDILLWQVAHKETQLYKDCDGWFLIMHNSCSYLLEDGRCSIYDRRPMICREHSSDDCEFGQEDEEDYELFFPDFDSLDAYCRKRFKGWDRRFGKSA